MSGEHPEPVRNAVVVPILQKDLQEVESTQRFFVQDRPPFSGPGEGQGTELLYVVNSADSGEFREQWEAVVDRTGIRNWFGGVSLAFADLDPKYDYYCRDRVGMPPTEEGYTAGPNLMFFHIAEEIGPRFGNTFLMELDCVPMQSDWLKTIFHEADRFPHGWMMGSRYHGWAWLPDRIQEHLNGNAVYRFGDSDFQRFLSEVWKPRMEQSVRWGYPEMAYDCLPATLKKLSRGPVVPPEFREDCSRMQGRLIELSSIVNLGGSSDQAAVYPEPEALAEKLPMAAILHGGWLAEKCFASTDPEEDAGDDPEDSADVESDSKVSPDTELELCLKHIWFSEGAWAFGNEFAMQESNPRLVLNVLVDTKIQGNLSVSVDADEDVDLTIRRWKEEVVRPSGVFLGLAGFLQAFSFLLRIDPLDLKARIRRWIHQAGVISGVWNLRKVKAWMSLFRGRKIGKGVNEVSVPISKIGKNDGVIVVIESPEGVLTRGRFHLEINEH